MQVRVQDDLADTLIQRASSVLRHAATSKSNAPADRTVRVNTGSASTSEKSPFPSTWSTGNKIQLILPKLSDTTDRSLFKRSRLARFDTHGYRHERGLRRPLFYKSGYLSCTKCNDVTFIDASALRSILELRGVVDSGNIRPESLPPCVGCGETAGLRVGAHDFLSLIEGEPSRDCEILNFLVLKLDVLLYYHIIILRSIISYDFQSVKHARVCVKAWPVQATCRPPSFCRLA